MHGGAPLDADDDLALVRRACAGAREAFGALVDRHQGRVFGLLAFLLRDAALREDVAQEAFLSAWQRLATFDPARGSFSTWLLAIVRHRALNALRGRRPAPVPAPEPCARPVAPDDDAIARRLDAALLELPVDQRLAYLLADVHGLPLAAVAEIEDVPEGTVKSRLARARERLRAALRPSLEPHP